jgi:hypothetical protein
MTLATSWNAGGGTLVVAGWAEGRLAGWRSAGRGAPTEGFEARFVVTWAGEELRGGEAASSHTGHDLILTFALSTTQWIMLYKCSTI